MLPDSLAYRFHRQGGKRMSTQHGAQPGVYQETLDIGQRIQSLRKRSSVGRFLVIASLAVFVSACAESSFIAHTAKRGPTSGESAYGTPGGNPVAGWTGNYRVGKPYQIKGQWYYPAEDFGYDQIGLASWYGTGFHGKPTASGEIFNENALTAAHPTLPMPTIVNVVNLENGRSLKLRINDRGPFKKGRIIDVSRRAAEILGFKGKGITRVRVTVLAEESMELKRRSGTSSASSRSSPSTSPPSTPTRQTQTAASPVLYSSPVVSHQPETVGVAPYGASVSAGETLAGHSAPHTYGGAPGLPPAGTPYGRPPAYQPIGQPNAALSSEPLFVQAGAFANLDNAKRFSSRIAAYGPVQVLGSNGYVESIYRVRLGPFSSAHSAADVRGQLVDAGVYDAHLVFN